MRSGFCGSNVRSWTGMERFTQIILKTKHLKVVQSWGEAEIQANAMPTHQQKGFFEPERQRGLRRLSHFALQRSVFS